MKMKGGLRLRLVSPSAAERARQALALAVLASLVRAQAERARAERIIVKQ